MLGDLRTNIEKLISAYEGQKNRAENLEAEVEKYKGRLESANKKILELEDKVDSLSLKSAFSSFAGENEQARAKIDKLIAEIDNALELLQ